MRRHPSIALRALRAFVVLVTVWCTGCSGYEPVLDAALGRSGVGMDCASEEGGSTSQAPVPEPGVAAQQPHAGAAISTLPMSSAEKGFSCGCSSCHAVTLASWSIAQLAVPAISLANSPELSLVSVGRVPLLPPPERTVA